MFIAFLVYLLQPLTCYGMSIADEDKFDLEFGFSGAKEFELLKDDEYVCREFIFEQERPVYVNGFVPQVNEKHLHHMLLVQCSANDDSDGNNVDFQNEPDKSDLYRCGVMYSEEEAEHDGSQICLNNEPYRIIYVWAHHATELRLNDTIGFNLGKSFRLVLQLHFNKPMLANTEESLLLLHSTYKPPPMFANIFLLFASNGTIPSKQKSRFELFCKVEEDVVIHPIAFRVHGHDIAERGTGFRVRLNNYGGEWSLIGSRSIQEPQIFKQISTNLTILKDDYIAFVCTMNNFKDHNISVGHARKNEMCNFYLMYYLSQGHKGMNMKACGSSGPPYNINGGFQSNPDFAKTKIPYELF
ncbi:hypothetical protein GJ496_011061 [Pomphorhynchus laevis]|nr:hypothetical protein GJ496_011061 [Pomphorhynchus laevis]